MQTAIFFSLILCVCDLWKCCVEMLALLCLNLKIVFVSVWGLILRICMCAQNLQNKFIQSVAYNKEESRNRHKARRDRVVQTNNLKPPVEMAASTAAAAASVVSLY